MAIVVQNSMMTYQPSLEFQASLGLWRCFVVDVQGLDEFQLTFAEPRSQPPVPPVGLPSLSGLPCLPLSSLVMPLVVKLYENREVVQDCVFWMAELLVHQGGNWVMWLFVQNWVIWTVWLFVQNRVIWTVWLFVQNRAMWTVWLFVLNCEILVERLFVLKGAIWIACLFVKVLKELGTESFVHYGYVATLSVLLFVSYSGLGFAFAGLGPSGWCRCARDFVFRFQEM